MISVVEIISRARETARLMVGLPRYDLYLQHMATKHPDTPAMSETEFFRDRQQARYGGKSGGRCC
jgi:uncharacterized short protein YbdD (DUF466 family)